MKILVDTNILVRNVNSVDPQHAVVNQALESLIQSGWDPCSDLLDRWLDLCTRYAVRGRQAHDTRLVALMLAHGITTMLSLNTVDFARYPEIDCKHPSNL